MGEHNIETKDGEQYPLLKMDSGGGDNNNHNPQPPSSVITSAYYITRTPKQSWIDRWPEFVSACCTTFILIAISFLAFYTLSMNAYRRKPLIITKYNASKQGSALYYHHIVARGSNVPFMLYSDYISSVAMQYPSLLINVILLMDDSSQNHVHGYRHTRTFSKLIYPSSNIFDTIYDQNNKKEIRNMQKKHPNVNVTIMPLSKYMALTPHRYKWRTIPTYYLNFYVKLFAVWQHGGIAMDLTTFNTIFNINQHPDRRYSAILKQHNDGIVNEKYVTALKKINQEEQNEMFTMFYLLIHHVLNATCSLFNRTLWYNNESSSNLSLDKPVIRSQRIKRDSHDELLRGESDLYAIALGLETTMKTTLNTTDNIDNSKPNANNSDILNTDDSQIQNIEIISKVNDTFNTENSIVLQNVTKQPIIVGLDKVFNYSSIHGEILPNIFFYDVYVADNIPSISEAINFPQAIERDDVPERTAENFNVFEQIPINMPILTISNDGTFIAAPSKHHPMLAYLLSFACQRFVNACHLKRHFGKVTCHSPGRGSEGNREEVIRHDLKIIAASMGIIQHVCLIIGCFTENPALFLPHMTAHLLMVIAKTLVAVLMLTKINLKSVIKLRDTTTAIALMMFNWCQEFCVFTQYLCLCDL